MSMTPKQLKFLDAFCACIAPRLDIAPSDHDTPGLLREAAALHQLYLAQGEDAFRVRADELLQNKPRGVKIIELAAELALAAGFMGDDLNEAAKYACSIADELESLFPNERER